ncbi:MAG: tyrosine-type recombinase/integrase [Eubacteriales bacterium]|nr:tyrosine-type recombinase/integrase [Eubacteriales bacterium]
MVAGHLQEKKNLYYIVLDFQDEKGKRRQKWLPTGLPIKGNKKKAEAMLADARVNFVPPTTEPRESETLFSDYLIDWLEIAKPTIAQTTYASYRQMTKGVIVPYFEERNITLTGIKPQDIQAFYTEQLKRVKASSVIHYHAVIHRALKYAVKIDVLVANPADKVERPRKEPFKASFYDSTEMEQLFEASRGTYLEIPILLGAFYGLRRSEVVGLRWEAIDFKRNTLTISHTVTSYTLDGKRHTIAQDTTKTKSSMRTLPLVPAIRGKLIAVKEQQKVYIDLCGKSYDKQYIGYICVNPMGGLITPNYITQTFPELLAKNNLRRIRFHDLRHSCASLLLANGVPMKQIQEWLGHSDFSTTANIYAHLDYNSKIDSAQAMELGLSAALSGVM